MSGNAVRVAIRTRPTASFAADQIIVEGNQLSVKANKTDNPKRRTRGAGGPDAVLHNASQETVYLEQVSPIVQSCLRGYNGTVMCYGQTGSGKTFTQVGSLESFQNRGLTPRAIAEIFTYISDHPQFEATVQVSYVEIHNDQLIDLLSTLPTANPITDPLALVEDKHGVTSVKNLRTVTVASEEEALAMLFEGSTNRQVANHQLNRNSTRGHAIFSVHIRIRSRVDSSGVVTKCKLNLVDLAGSERLKKTVTDGALASESMYINRSLTYLEQVVVALSSKGRSHTPYRQSKLTHLLQGFARRQLQDAADCQCLRRVASSRGDDLYAAVCRAREIGAQRGDPQRGDRSGDVAQEVQDGDWRPQAGVGDARFARIALARRVRAVLGPAARRAA